MKGYVQAEKIKLVHSGSDYFSTLENLIEKANETIHLQTYIFENDETGKRIIQALKKAKERKVKIFVLADAFGSKSFSSQAAKELNNSGINFRFFSPLFSSEAISFGRRLHHKIALADKNAALVGGINIAGKYNDASEDAPWLDYSALVEGKACEALFVLCDGLYNRNQKQVRRVEDEKTEAVLAPVNNSLWVRFRRNDWIRRQNEIHNSYTEALITAKESIILVASYFLPGRTFRKILREAAQRGVRIQIILAGKSDIPFFRFAENYLYQFYLDNNIHLYEWNNSVMHGKAMCVDNKWATIGSYNLNRLSHYISIELNADIIDQDFLLEFTTHLNNIIEGDCLPVSYEVKQVKPNWFSRLKMRIIFSLYKAIIELLKSGRRRRREKIKN